jgi:hypothetical protein
MAFIASIIGSILIGGTVATAAVVGIVSNQTAVPDKSPVSVTQPADELIPYGG